MANQNIKTRKAYRQGELLFIPLSQEDMTGLGYGPDSESHPKWSKLQTNVIREGEATGHKHEIITQSPDVATLLAPISTMRRGLNDMALIGNDDRLLLSEQQVEVVHPEHDTLMLPKGGFLIVVQREYDEVKSRRILD